MHYKIHVTLGKTFTLSYFLTRMAPVTTIAENVTATHRKKLATANRKAEVMLNILLYFM